MAVSEYARRALLQEGLPERLITTIHNGLPLEHYRRTEPGFLRNQLGLPPHQPLAGLVGRHTPWKGQDFFLRLAQAWIRQNQTGHFVLIGHAFNEDQAYEAALRRFVSEHGLSARVHFLPFQQNMAAVLSDLNLLVHASVLPEPFGRVIIEAMAVGTPVLAARAGGVPEIITHEVTGWLAEPGHLESYLAQLQKRCFQGPIRLGWRKRLDAWCKSASPWNRSGRSLKVSLQKPQPGALPRLRTPNPRPQPADQAGTRLIPTTIRCDETLMHMHQSFVRGQGGGIVRNPPDQEAAASGKTW